MLVSVRGALSEGEPKKTIPGGKPGNGSMSLTIFAQLLKTIKGMNFLFTEPESSVRQDDCFVNSWKWRFFMRVSFIYVMLVICGIELLKAHEGYGQGLDKRVTLEMKNETLTSLFQKLKQETRLSFVFPTHEAAAYSVNLSHAKRTVKEVLDLVLKDKNLTYRFEENTVYIVVNRVEGNEEVSAKEEEDSSEATVRRVENAVVNAFTVTGTVKDAGSQELMPGVNVVIKGTTFGTSTNAQGTYTLENVSSDAVLVFSFIGYEIIEVVVGNQTTIDVALKSDVKSLDEVIVVGYGTTKKEDLTTAVVKVNPKDVPTAANSSITDLMFGRAAGVQVSQQSAEPGGQINLSVRGRPGTPLYIVDGVVYPNNALDPGNGDYSIVGGSRGGLAGLNPNDIESIEILKDASAAIYGVAAANGVVLITTKKGKAGRINVTYNGSRSVVSNLPYIEPLNASDYMSYYNQLNQDKYLAGNNMAPFGNVAADLSGYTPKFSSQQIQSAGAGTDWLGNVLRNGSVDNHDLSVNGGAEKVTYFFSGNYFNQVGTLENSHLERYTGRMNLSFNLTKFLTLNTSVNGSRNNNQNPSSGYQKDLSGAQGFNALQAALTYPAYLPITDPNGNYTLFTGLSAPNPVSMLWIKDQTNFNSLLANISTDITIIPDVLTAKLLYGNSYESTDRDFYIPSTVYFALTNLSKAFLGHATRQNQTMEATTSFKKEFAQWIKLDAVAGVGQYIYDFSSFTVQGQNVFDAIGTDRLDNAQNTRITSNADYNKKRSFFARASFDILDRYFLSFSVRRDGFDKFYPNKKYANFPAASLAWKISNESFFQGMSMINLFKLRASYGKTGDLGALGNYAYGGYAPGSTGIVFGDGKINVPYLLTSLDNPSLTWPSTKTLNIGLDLGFNEDRISASLDWYTEEQTTLLAITSTPPLSQIGKAPINGAAQQRTGFEFGLNSVNINKGDFRWSTSLNVTNYVFKWKERFPNSSLNPFQKVDDKVNTIYAYQTSGIVQIGRDAPAWQPTQARQPGSPVFVDKNSDGILDYQDVVSYSGDPKVIIGLGNNFKYKNFDLNIFFYGQRGAWGIDNTYGYSSAFGFLSLGSTGTSSIRNTWSTNNPEGTLPGAAYNGSSLGLNTAGPGSGTDLDLIQRDFIRCRNITLGYTFNPTATKWMKNLRVYADVQNAFLISKFKTVDPEVNTALGGSAPYPMARTISFGINANF